jgi:hypothetical protein
MANTKRVDAPVTLVHSKRVFTTGVVPGSGSSVGTNVWGGTWGATWGNVWSSSALAVADTPASPSINATTRVAGTVTANITKRIAA